MYFLLLQVYVHKNGGVFLTIDSHTIVILEGQPVSDVVSIRLAPRPLGRNDRGSGGGGASASATGSSSPTYGFCLFFCVFFVIDMHTQTCTL